jgi:hypothetical protein
VCQQRENPVISHQSSYLSTASQILAAINTNQVTINDLKNSLPAGVTLPPELENIELGSQVEDVKQLLREKCKKESGSDDAFEKAGVSQHRSAFG